MENKLNYINLIKTLPIFTELDPADLQQLLHQEDVLSIVAFKTGEKIITEKRFDRKIYLLLKGTVNVCKEVLSGNCKVEKIIKTITGDAKGKFLGEITAFTGKPRTASVIAADEAVCLMINIARLTDTSSTLLDRVKKVFYPKLFEIPYLRLTEMDENFAKAKQNNEDFVKKIFEIKREKMELRDRYEDEIRKKNAEIAALQAQLQEKEPSRS